MKFGKDIQSGLYLPQAYKRPSPFNRISLQHFAYLADIDGEDAGSTPWEWTALTVSGSSTFALSDVEVNNGSGSYAAAVDAASDACNGRFDFSGGAESEAYFRFYAYVPSYAQTGYSQEVLGALCSGNEYTRRASVKLDNTGAAGDPDRWYFDIDDGTSSTSATNFSLSAWHCFEIHFLGGATGTAEFWVDGDQLWDAGEVDLTGETVSCIACGPQPYAAKGATTFYFDDIIADTTYIGPISAGGSSVPIILNLMRRRHG